MTDEDRSTARSVSHAGSVERAADRQTLEVVPAGLRLGVQLVHTRRVPRLDQRDTHGLRSRFDSHAKLALVGFVDPLSIEHDVYRWRGPARRTGKAESAAGADPELIFRVQRKMVGEQDASARTQRQPVQVLPLR